MTGEKREAMLKRQAELKDTINQIDAGQVSDEPRREAFFETVYENASGDAAMVPWADLAAKDKLANWLAETVSPADNTPKGRAVDVGCGLGDNAEALSAAGYKTLGFDFSPKAIAWANKRFSQSLVDYQHGDLFDLPREWLGAFDLVHECYTLQSIPPETLQHSMPAVASLVAPGGTLLVYTRVRENGEPVDGPPWPLEQSQIMAFENLGLELQSREAFDLERPDKTIPHVFCIWRRPK